MTVSFYERKLPRREENTIRIAGPHNALMRVAKGLGFEDFTYGVTSFFIEPPTGDHNVLNVTYLEPSGLTDFAVREGCTIL